MSDEKQSKSGPQPAIPGPSPSLKRILYQRAKAARVRTIESGGDVSAEEVEALNRLAKIVEIWDKAAARQPGRLIVIPGIFLLTLVLVSILLFGHIRFTDIELSLVSDDVQFVLSEPRQVTARSALAEVAVAGQTATEIPSVSTEEESSDFGGVDNILLSVSGSGKLTIPAMMLPPNTWIQIVKSPILRQYRLSLGGTQFNLQADMLGAVKVVSGGQRSLRNFHTPKAVRFKSGPEPATLTLTFLKSPVEFFQGGLPVKNLKMLSVEYVRGEDSPARVFSPILGGSILFQELNGAEQILRSGEWVRFATSSGELRSVSLKDEHIVLQFHGMVSGLSIGPQDHASNAMPTMLEWLRVQRSATLLWGSALYLFAFVMAAVRWFRASI